MWSERALLRFTIYVGPLSVQEGSLLGERACAALRGPFKVYQYQGRTQREHTGPCPPYVLGGPTEAVGGGDT